MWLTVRLCFPQSPCLHLFSILSRLHTWIIASEHIFRKVAIFFSSCHKTIMLKKLSYRRESYKNIWNASTSGVAYVHHIVTLMERISLPSTNALIWSAEVKMHKIWYCKFECLARLQSYDEFINNEPHVTWKRLCLLHATDVVFVIWENDKTSNMGTDIATYLPLYWTLKSRKSNDVSGEYISCILMVEK